MPFDARAAKLLQPGQHLLILPEHPGLRIERTASRWSWIYRYRSLVDDGVRQAKLGEWPRMGYPEAVLKWGELSGQRAAGKDPVLEKRSARRAAQAAKEEKKRAAYTVAMLVQDYLEGHINVNRKPKGRLEIKRVLEKGIVPIAERPAALLQRNEAFKLLQDLQSTPVIAFRCARNSARPGTTAWTPARCPRTRRTGGSRSCAAGCAARERRSQARTSARPSAC